MIIFLHKMLGSKYSKLFIPSGINIIMFFLIGINIVMFSLSLE